MTFLDYADTAEAAFLSAGGHWTRYSTHIRRLLNIFLCMSQIGSNAVYILFVAQNIMPVGYPLSFLGYEAFISVDCRDPLRSRLELQDLHRYSSAACYPDLQHQKPQVPLPLLCPRQHSRVRRSRHHLLLHLRDSPPRLSFCSLVRGPRKVPNFLWHGDICF